MTAQDSLNGSSTHPSLSPWLTGYSMSFFADIDPQTLASYVRALRQIMGWIAEQPETTGPFQPVYLKPPTVETYIQKLLDEGRSLPHVRRVRRAIKGFSLWLIAKGELISDPTEGFVLPSSKRRQEGPRTLTDEQRRIVLSLIASSDDLRGKAIFALVYWAGFRASEISRLLRVHTMVERGNAQISLVGPETAARTISVHESARLALLQYLEQGERQSTSAYVFTSQREAVPAPASDLDGWRLGTRAIHSWFRELKGNAPKDERSSIASITLLALRHDFGFRAQTAGWEKAEVAAYLGLTPRRKASSSPQRSLDEELVDIVRWRGKLARIEGFPI